MIYNNRVLLRELESVESTITDAELFASEQYFEYLDNALQVALAEKDIKREVKLKAFYEPKSNFTACTSATETMVNTASPIIKGLATRGLKHLCIIGHIVHEVGHRLFTDFPVWEICNNQFLKGCWYPKMPAHPNAEKLSNAVKRDRRFAAAMLNIYHNIQNIYEDEYIENRNHTVFQGEFIKGQHIARKQINVQKKPLKTMIQDILDGKTTFVVMAMNCMLIKASGFDWDAEGCEDDPIYMSLLEVFDKAEPFMNDLAWQSNTKKRCEDVNNILCIVSEYIMLPEPEEEKEGTGSEESEETGESENPENPGESGESGEGNPPVDSTGAPKEDIRDMSSSAASEIMKSSEMGSGRDRPIDAKVTEEDKMSAETSRSNAEHDTSTKSDSSSLESEIAKAMRDIMTRIAEANIEKEFEEELCAEARKIKLSEEHEFVPWRYVIERKSSVSRAETDFYKKVYRSVSPIANMTKRMLNNILKERKEEGLSKGYITGRFNTQAHVRSMYSGDGKSFSRNLVPNGNPDVVFGVLIDQSGSMHGEKIGEARKSAILLDDVLSSLKLPYLMVGHTTESCYDGTCELYPYHMFEDIDHKDKYRLASIDAKAGNRDGAAITYCCKKLQERPEKRKILIVITDGEPAEVGFHSHCGAVEDTRLTVKKFSRDITIFGAVIDGNMVKMKQIYDNRILDLTDLDTLPIGLTSLIRRSIK